VVTTNWHEQSAEQVCSALGVDSGQGWSSADAERRLREDGANELPEAARKSMWKVFAAQFASPLIYILIVAAVVAYSLGHRGDSTVILIVVFINAIIGAVQEGRAERSMEALRSLSALKTRVVRGGVVSHIEARELVKGDIVLLAAGDAVAADARLVEAAALEMSEAALTGESLPTAKDIKVLPAETALPDRRNMVYSGTYVAAGRGRAVVVATGLATEVGDIARMTTSATDAKTPLEQRIGQFGRYLVVAAIGMFAIVLGIGYLRGMAFLEVFMVAISQMVSMVPEGLPVAMTIALAVGMQRMARRRAIVRRLSAVETLGSTSIICSDKTGTLTKNEMTVTRLWLPGGKQFEVSGVGYEPRGEIDTEGRPANPSSDAGLGELLEAAVLCNDAQVLAPDGVASSWRALGDPTEAALITLGMKAGIDSRTLSDQYPRQAEIPFDATTKMMAVQIAGAGGGAGRVLIKGAPEEVLALCGRQLKEGAETGIDNNALREVEATAAVMAADALRLLAVASIEAVPIDGKQGFAAFRGKAVFLGLLGQIDPPREEVKISVQRCRDAGIRPVMVTGDHKATGLAIARLLGIALDGDIAINGTELESMSDDELRAVLDRVSVFARVQPAQKLRIVKAFQAQGNTVAMTGDGVNDAPALAVADVGVAMGISGTDVAKSAAEIVISDDNFATIVNAVEEGRLVYRNLKKVILYLFATSMAEIAVLLGALALGYPLPLAAVQILWINIVTEGTVTVNLIMEPGEEGEMTRPPIPFGEALLNRSMLKRVSLMTPMMVASTFGYFLWRLSSGVEFVQVQTETFTVLAVCQWFNVLNCRSDQHSAFDRQLFKNRWLLGGLVLGNGLHFLVIYTEALNAVFHTVPIGVREFVLIGVVASAVLWVEELRKFIVRRSARSDQ